MVIDKCASTGKPWIPRTLGEGTTIAECWDRRPQEVLLCDAPGHRFLFTIRLDLRSAVSGLFQHLGLAKALGLARARTSTRQVPTVGRWGRVQIREPSS